MLEHIFLAGALGGIVRILMGFWKYETPSGKAIFISVFIGGVVGLAFSMVGVVLFPFLKFTEIWKAFFASWFVGYVGLDIMNSFWKILSRKGVRI